MQFHRIKLHSLPLDREVDFLRQVYPEEAEAADRIVAALESGALPGWPPAGTAGHDEAEARGRKRQRSGSHGRSRSRSERRMGGIGRRGRSRSGGERATGGSGSGSGGMPPVEVLLAPVFVRGTNYAGWALTSADVLLTCACCSSWWHSLR